MADITQGHAHGTPAGATAHRRAGTPMCRPCRDADNDYRQAWRIATGETKNVRVPVNVLRAILRGSKPTAVLAHLGPKTLHALREGTVPRG